VNQPISEEHYDRLRARLVEYVANKPLFAQDCHIGAHPDHRRSLRVYTETAWASIFARNLFRRPSAEDLAAFTPNFTIINVPSFKADPSTEGTRSETAILVHLKRMEVIIVGTEYAGEIKKSAFTVMNYLLPDEGVLPMHSAVNVGAERDSVVFFGLSGTGKTTLSADPERISLASEHGSAVTGLQLRGRLPKTIRLRRCTAGYRDDEAGPNDPRERRADPAGARPRLRSDHREHPRRLPARLHRQRRPDGHRRPAEERRPADRRRVRRAAAHLEADPRPGRVPLHQRLHGQARGDRGRGQGADGDVLGVLRGAVHAAPPGRVRGDADRTARATASVWLVNTGWTGGPYGTAADEHQPHPDDGPAALNGGSTALRPPTDLRFEVPTEVPGVPSGIDPRSTWADGAAYDAQAATRRCCGCFRSYADGRRPSRNPGPVVPTTAAGTNSRVPARLKS
jgi:phosphoenolpyruvate carboxykinase (ATP)